LRNLTSFKWNHKRICRVCKSWSWTRGSHIANI
jgi:hypothetical protein